MITLTTDFGTKDAYVASMKGAIATIAPRTAVVDITHEIEAQNISQAAFCLLSSYRFFPKGSIHIAVVDPGVGSRRRILCAKAPSGYFIAPDNGLLAPILKQEKRIQVREITNAHYFLKNPSRTFQGRDIMAPVAAHLSKQVPFARLGPLCQRFKKVNWKNPKSSKDKIQGEIIHVDHFGNLITNIGTAHLKPNKLPRNVRVGRGVAIPWGNHYESVAQGKTLALIGSAELVEVAVREGSAAQKLKARIGMSVHLSF